MKHQRADIHTQQRTSTRLLSLLVATATVASLATVAVASPAQAAPDDAEWTALQAQLAGITGSWTSQAYSGALTTGMPETALLGNGDVGVVSGGGTGYKTFYVTKGDLWSGSNTAPAGLGSVSIKPVTVPDAGAVDLAVGSTATASNHYQDFTPDRAVNGQWGAGYEGWVTQVGKPQWLALDLGEVKTIARYVVRFDSAARPAETVNNGKDFVVQSSTNGTDWVDVDTVTNNTAGTVEKTVGPITTRYVRLFISEPTQATDADSTNNPRARVGAFELYAPVANVNLALGATATATSNHPDFPASRAVSGAWGPGYEGWVTNVGKPQTITLDLHEPQTIARYVLKHDGAARPAETANNTKNFVVQVSTNNTDWTTVDTVTNNTASITDKSITPVTARYLRITASEPVQNLGEANPRARIGQIELYGSDAPVTPPAPPTQFLEEENILDARVDTDVNIGSADVAMHTWVAANDNVVVTELTSEADEDVALQLETWAGATSGTARAGSTATSGVDGSTLWAARATSPNGNPAWIGRAALATRLLGAELTETGATGPTASGRFTLEPGQTVQIVTGVGGGGRNATDHVQQAEALANPLTEDSVGELRAEHAEWWKQYWLTSHVSLGDPLLEKYYYSALYFMGSASREGKQAPGIFGIWSTQDNAMWDGDYHLNYNAQAPFYGLYSANRADFALPFTQTILDYVPEAQRRAKQDLSRLFPSNIGIGSRPDLANGIDDAVFFPVGIGPFGSTTDDNYHHQTLDSLFNATQFISYYEYTGDTDYLENTAYPYLVKTANFFEKYLQFDDATDEYFMWSAHHEGTWAKNSSPDIGMLKHLLTSLVEESTTLGVDADKRVTWQHILDHLPDMPTSVYNGKTVYSLAEPGTTTIPGDDGGGSDVRDIRPGDQPVNLEFVTPGEQIGINSPADQRQIAIDSLAGMNSWGQDNAFPKVFTIAARIGWPADDIITRLKGQITGHMGPNLRIVSSQHGIEKNGAIEAIDSMLLQSSEGRTNVFANWPADKDASFTKLRAKDAFVVSAAQTGGVVGPVSITSDAGNTMRLTDPWAAPYASVVDGEGQPVEFTLDDGVIAFDTEAGEDYVVSAAELPADTTAPVASATVDPAAPAPSGWYLTLPSATLTASDAESGVASIEYRLGSGEWTAYTAPVVVPDGTASLEYRATDAAGNVSAVQSLPLKVDTVDPTAEASIADDRTVTVTGADAGSGVERLEYSIGAIGDWQAYGSPFAVDTDESVVYVRAADAAGNTGAVEELGFGGAELSRDSVTAGDPVTVTGRGFAPGALVSFTLESEPVAIGTAVADAQGAFSQAVTIPADTLTGDHHVVVGVLGQRVSLPLHVDALVVPTDEPTDVPTDTPTDVPTDTPTDDPGTPSDTPSDAPSSAPSSSAAPVAVDGSLPGTGIAAGAIGGIALLLLAAGASVIIIRRRTRANAE
ncbi:OmpL47-type beta-barrel domain-containing protein [Compostimonas suwonensis]|uniref:F5/8 type C domain-containing protein n=1 Tax=Compostimonas suwonensis TaxID=1048394 RepID=A0A2M9BVB2_9MICO|nr:discoidin domain-containing protein [Compostimonas suwonensis]PJJ61889.1 F5/8 type C domain-containing protein [Compostimonas suwonensis]